MRTLLLILACIGIGFTIAKVRHDRRVAGMVHLMGAEEGVRIGSDREKISSAIETQQAKKVGKIEVVNGSKLDFGLMMRGTKRSHKFIFKNTGDGVANIWFISSSCKCTLGKFKEAKLEAGEESDVELEWKAESAVDEFGQTATIGSDCPGQEEIKLVIQGKIGDAYMFDPPPYKYGDIFTNQETRIPFTVYSFQEAPINIASGQVQDAVLSKRIKVDIGEEKILAPGEIPTMEGARRLVECTIRLLPGIAAGPINIELKLARKNESKGEEEDTEFLVYNVRGRCVTPVRIIAGDDYSETRNILSLGSTKSSQGLKKSFMLAIRNEDAKIEPNVRITKLIPSQLKATLGTPKISASQQIYPVTIEIPPGAEPIELDGTFSKDFGRIVIETDIESSPEIPIFLKFKITE
ncbi:MAG: DUF1573 domain-containing protein [Planctomycetota bacterium]